MLRPCVPVPGKWTRGRGTAAWTSLSCTANVALPPQAVGRPLQQQQVKAYRLSNSL